MTRVCINAKEVGIGARDVGTALLLSSCGFGSSLTQGDCVVTIPEPTETPEVNVNYTLTPEAEALYHHYTSVLGVPDEPRVKWFCHFCTEIQQYSKSRNEFDMAPPSAIKEVQSPADPQVDLNGHKVYVQTRYGYVFLDLDRRAVKYVLACMERVRPAIQATAQSKAFAHIESVVDQLKKWARIRVYHRGHELDQSDATEAARSRSKTLKATHETLSKLEGRLKQDYAESSLKDEKFSDIRELPAWRDMSAMSYHDVFMMHPESALWEGDNVDDVSIGLIMEAELNECISRDPALRAWKVLSDSISCLRKRLSKSRSLCVDFKDVPALRKLFDREVQFQALFEGMPELS